MQSILIKIAVAIFVLSSAESANAAIYKCDNNGKTTIQDRPCTDGKQKNLSKPSSIISKDIHPSWFDRPAYLDGKVECIDNLCKCEGYGRRFASDENELRRVLTNFKGSWVRYERQHRKYNKYGKSSAGRLSLEKQACEVAVKQAMVKKIYGKNIAKLRQTLSLSSQNEQPGENCDALQKNRPEWVECANRARLQNHENTNEAEKLQKDRDRFIKSMKILATPREEYLAKARI